MQSAHSRGLAWCHYRQDLCVVVIRVSSRIDLSPARVLHGSHICTKGCHMTPQRVGLVLSLEQVGYKVSHALWLNVGLQSQFLVNGM